MSGELWDTRWILSGSMCLAIWSCDLLAQEAPSVLKREPTEGKADEEASIPAAARGVAGMHGWVASDYFESKEAILACDAIYWRDQKRLALMIEAGLDVNAKNQDGFTLLHWAVASNSFECFKILLEAGADPDVSLTKTISTKDGPVFYGHIFFIEDTILHSCARNLWDKYLIEGLKYCQQPDLQGAGGQRLTKIICETRGGSDALKLVLAAGASPNFSDSGQSGYVGALIIDDFKVIRILLDFNADPLYGDISSERLLKMVDDQTNRYAGEQYSFERGVLNAFRQAVITRAEQLKAEKESGATPKSFESRSK
jgi:hypothetical protein